MPWWIVICFLILDHLPTFYSLCIGCQTISPVIILMWSSLLTYLPLWHLPFPYKQFLMYSLYWVPLAALSSLSYRGSANILMVTYFIYYLHLCLIPISLPALSSFLCHTFISVGQSLLSIIQFCKNTMWLYHWVQGGSMGYCLSVNWKGAEWLITNRLRK